MDPDTRARAVLDAAVGPLAARLGVAVGARPLGSTGPLADVPPLTTIEELTTIEDLGHLYEAQLGATARLHAGAHYTPRALADEVVEHALAPLVHDASGELLPVDDLLALRVADIACGTGAFLLSAARYLAARVQESSGWSASRSVHAVVSTCVVGGDLDATAVEVCRLSLRLLAGDPDLALEDRVLVGDSLLDVAPDGTDRPVIPWTRHFADVMARGGFDAVIGNPPFLGVKRIRSAVGTAVRDAYAATLLDGSSGRSDLVVFFLARAGALSRDVVGLVLPDAVAEGDTARFGLARLVAGGAHVYRAERSRPWPGEAGVRIALVWLRRGAPTGEVVLDGQDVAAIGPTLRTETVAEHAPRVPPAWMPHGHQATIVLGRSLLLSASEAEAMVAEDARAARWIRPYLSGDDLVSSVGPHASRRVLDLGRTDLATLRAVPPIARRLEAVETERAGQLARYPQLADRWWGFLSPVDRLYDALAGLDETIALAKHAKYVWPVLVPTGQVVSNGAIVYPTDDRAVLAFLASVPHRLWATRHGGSRLNQSHRYNPSRLLRTYPFPATLEGLRGPGELLADAMRAARDELQVGVTEVLNRVHAPGVTDPVVLAVRNAVVEVDRAALAAHGIDLVVRHEERGDGDRRWFGLDEETHRAVLAALGEQALSPVTDFGGSASARG